MALPKPTTAIARLRAANNDAYDANTNPDGLAEGGHRQNWVPNAQAEVDVAQWVESIGGDVQADADRFEAAVEAIEAGPVTSVNGRSGAVMGLAETDSPAFTGNPTAPTPTAGDNDTSIATTAFVQAAIPSALDDSRRAFKTNLHYGS